MHNLALMKKTILFLILSIFLSANTCKQDVGDTVIYLVRHAEKLTDGPDKERGLTTAGLERAEALSEVLKDEPIKAVYATVYKRTQLTGKPTAKQHGHEIQIYDKKDLENFAKNVLTKHNGEHILVVGHSDTTPRLLNVLMQKDAGIYISESTYDNLFKITINKNVPILNQLKYGDKS